MNPNNNNNNPRDRQHGKVSSLHFAPDPNQSTGSNLQENDGAQSSPRPHNGDSTTNMSLFSLLMQGQADPSTSLPPPLWPSPQPQPPPNDMPLLWPRSELNNGGRSSSLSAIHQALTLVEEMEEFLPPLPPNPSGPQSSSSLAAISARRRPLYSRSASPPQQRPSRSQHRRRNGTNDDDSASRQ
jgi:hypothetical protein